MLRSFRDTTPSIGNPVTQKRALTEREIKYLVYVADHYILLTEDYRG